jgi:hypothetical protein
MGVEVTQQEAVLLAANIIGVDPADAVGALILVAMKDGQVGVSSTGTCSCMALQMMSRAIERIADGLHSGDEPGNHESAGAPR